MFESDPPSSASSSSPSSSTQRTFSSLPEKEDVSFKKNLVSSLSSPTSKTNATPTFIPTSTSPSASYPLLSPTSIPFPLLNASNSSSISTNASSSLPVNFLKKDTSSYPLHSDSSTLSNSTSPSSLRSLCFQTSSINFSSSPSSPPVAPMTSLAYFLHLSPTFLQDPILPKFPKFKKKTNLNYFNHKHLKVNMNRDVIISQRQSKLKTKFNLKHSLQTQKKTQDHSLQLQKKQNVLQHLNSAAIKRQHLIDLRVAKISTWMQRAKSKALTKKKSNPPLQNVELVNNNNTNFVQMKKSWSGSIAERKSFLNAMTFASSSPSCEQENAISTTSTSTSTSECFSDPLSFSAIINSSIVSKPPSPLLPSTSLNLSNLQRSLTPSSMVHIKNDSQTSTHDSSDASSDASPSKSNSLSNPSSLEVQNSDQLLAPKISPYVSPILSSTSIANHFLKRSTSLPTFSKNGLNSDEDDAGDNDDDENENEDIESSTLSLLEPPITHSSLHELTLSEIITNPQLLHDLYFDEDLQFQPNPSTPLHPAYWESLQEELERGEWTYVPLLIDEIQDILNDLIPLPTALASMLPTLNLKDYLPTTWRTQPPLHETWVEVTQTLANYLHETSAPCRDAMIDTMVEKMMHGHYVEGLRLCLQVMEGMKLDFANHHLKQLRPWVLNHAAEMEWRCFKQKYFDLHQVQSLNSQFNGIERTEAWLMEAFQKNAKSWTLLHPAHLVNQALLDLVLDTSLFHHIDIVEKLPETLWMDGPRITHFHHRFQDLTILTVLLLILKQHIPSLSSKEVEDQKHRLWILLNDSTTTLDHLGDHFTYLSSSTATPSTSFSALLTTFLSMDHPVFQQVQRQLRSICLECVNTDASSCIKLKKSDLMGLGCIEIHSELLTLAQQLKMFFLHQRNTYAVLYNVIYYVWQQNWEMGEEA